MSRRRAALCATCGHSLNFHSGGAICYKVTDEKKYAKGGAAGMCRCKTFVVRKPQPTERRRKGRWIKRWTPIQPCLEPVSLIGKANVFLTRREAANHAAQFDGAFAARMQVWIPAKGGRRGKV